MIKGNLVADFVYVVWSIPDYIGIEIEAIYRNEADAIKCVEEHNATAASYEKWGYDAEPLL